MDLVLLSENDMCSMLAISKQEATQVKQLFLTPEARAAADAAAANMAAAERQMGALRMAEEQVPPVSADPAHYEAGDHDRLQKVSSVRYVPQGPPPQMGLQLQVRLCVCRPCKPRQQPASCALG